MKKRIVKLTESDLHRIVKRVIRENEEDNLEDFIEPEPETELESDPETELVSSSDKNLRNVTLKLRRERFLKVAPKRVNEIIMKIRNLERLAQKSNYAGTPEDFKKIISALKKEIEEIENILLGNKKMRSPFTLEEYDFIKKNK